MSNQSFNMQTGANAYLMEPSFDHIDKFNSTEHVSLKDTSQGKGSFNLPSLK